LNDFQRLNRNPVLVFALDEPRYAMELSAVERVVRAVEITPLPKAPEIVLGIVNAHGRILPVLNIRERFRLPARDMKLDDRLVIARTARRVVALVVDAVIGIRDVSNGQMVSAESLLPFAKHLKGVAKTEDGLVLIYDLDQFLSLDEERTLDMALAGDMTKTRRKATGTE
jgi:purine-binding chemotaxis protein CheW